MKFNIFAAAACFLALSNSAHAGPSTSTAIYAAEYCHSGCAAVNTLGNFYFGAKVKTYRVCTAAGYPASISVDGVTVSVPASKFNVRGCVDVSGLSLGLSSGEIVVGPLPD